MLYDEDSDFTVGGAGSGGAVVFAGGRFARVLVGMAGRIVLFVALGRCGITFKAFQAASCLGR